MIKEFKDAIGHHVLTGNITITVAELIQMLSKVSQDKIVEIIIHDTYSENVFDVVEQSDRVFISDGVCPG